MPTYLDIPPSVTCAVPQASTSGPLMYRVPFQNQLLIILTFHFWTKNFEQLNVIKHELKRLVQWLRSDKLSLNEIKTEIIVSRSPTGNTYHVNLTLE